MRDAIGGILGASAIAVGCAVSGCEIVPEMDTRAPVANIAHSGKAIVVTSSVEDQTGPFGRLSPTTVNAYVDQNVTTPGPDGLVRNAFTAYGGTGAYLVEPGAYYLAGINSSATHASLAFDKFDSPVRFTVSAGDVVYLGELRMTKILYSQDVSCGAAMVFTVSDHFAAERADITDMLDDKYPGAKKRLRDAPFKVDSSILHVKPRLGCLLGH